MVSEVFRSSDDYIQKQLDKVGSEGDTDQPTIRLILDIADILTGPTSGGNARYLAECMCRHPKEVAERMREIAERYLAAIGELKPSTGETDLRESLDRILNTHCEYSEEDLNLEIPLYQEVWHELHDK